MRSRKTKILAAIVAISFLIPGILVGIATLMPKEQPSGRASEVVVFTGAPGWTGGRTCNQMKQEPRCDSEWRHESGQLVNVLVFDVADPRALAGFVDKLTNEVTSKGGVVEKFQQNDMQLVRYLQQVEGAALINYALMPRNQNALHVISSVVPFEEQRPADDRMRALLEHASWAPR